MANSKLLTETAEIQHLRSSIHHLVEQHNRTNNKLIGVQVLTDQLEQKTQECEGLKATVKQLEVLLSRAENRLAQLSVKGGSSKGGIVTPGISKKLFEAIAKENTKLKIALEHVVNKQPNGIELAVENRDLHDLVIALKGELARNREETEELRDALKAVESEDTMSLQEQIAHLTAQITQLERSLKGRQMYCEQVLRENETLKANLEAVKTERITQLASLKKMAGDNPAVKEVLELAWTGDDALDGSSSQNRDIEKYTKEIESLKKQVEELKEQRARSYDESKKHLEGLTRQIQELTNTNTMMHEEMAQMKAQLEEANLIKELSEQQCKGYENDFKIEQQEKLRIDADFKKLLKQNQDIQQENKALKRDHDRMTKMIKEEFDRQQKQNTKKSPPAATTQRIMPQWPTATTSAATGYKPPHFNPMNHSELVVSDSPGSKCQTVFECPICHCILPQAEIEEHLADCDRGM